MAVPSGKTGQPVRIVEFSGIGPKLSQHEGGGRISVLCEGRPRHAVGGGPVAPGLVVRGEPPRGHGISGLSKPGVDLFGGASHAPRRQVVGQAASAVTIAAALVCPAGQTCGVPEASSISDRRGKLTQEQAVETVVVDELLGPLEPSKGHQATGEPLQPSYVPARRRLQIKLFTVHGPQTAGRLGKFPEVCVRT